MAFGDILFRPGPEFSNALMVFYLKIRAVSLEAQRRAAGVLVDIVDEREISDTQAVIGQLVANRRSEVATRIAGVARSKRGDPRVCTRRGGMSLFASELSVRECPATRSSTDHGGRM